MGRAPARLVRTKFYIYLSPGLRERLDAYADEFGHTLSQTVVGFIVKEIRRYEQEKGILRQEEAPPVTHAVQVGVLRHALRGLPDESVVTDLDLLLKGSKNG